MKPHILGLSHDHIDGNRSLMVFIETMHMEMGIDFGFKDVLQWQNYLRNSQIPIEVRFKTITRVLQSEASLRFMAFTYAANRRMEGYLAVEGKFAPQYHTHGGLTMRQATRAVYNGLLEAETATGIMARPFHICIGREADEDMGIEVAKIALEYDGDAILDLACSEPGNPPEKHHRAYELTFDTNVKRECHAGEWLDKRRGEPRETYRKRLLENVRTAIFDLKCDGIGHAIPLAHDADLVKYVADNQIRVSMCPLSNLVLGHIDNVRQLKINELLDAGVWITLNPDDDLFLPDMREVIEKCEMWYSFTKKQSKQLTENSIRML